MFNSMVKVLNAEEMRKLRYEHSLLARKMTVEEMHMQMRRNGSVPSPNPWYRGPEKAAGSSTAEDSKS